MGRRIYFTNQEIEKLIDYAGEAIGILGEAEGTAEQTERDMKDGLGSAMRKLYKGRNGERIYAEYKTKRERNVRK